MGSGAKLQKTGELSRTFVSKLKSNLTVCKLWEQDVLVAPPIMLLGVREQLLPCFPRLWASPFALLPRGDANGIRNVSECHWRGVHCRLLQPVAATVIYSLHAAVIITDRPTDLPVGRCVFNH